ncbi:MAG: class I SAM-dependent methyltransferase [Dehalococcoidia bacterium]|nr:class I SAM-dependent methyltransferase [Dehalococcoidia bacterium]
MNLSDLVDRALPPAAWAEGDNIPWDDPPFSERMLAWHLRQDSDAASRPSEKIDAQVRWLHEALLDGERTRVLDLACGPGLYTSRLARLGHECHGIDFAPAAVAHARGEAEREGLACSYELADVRNAAFGGRAAGEGFGLAMMISGQLNVFRRRQAAQMLRRAFQTLVPGGRLLLEPQRLATVVDGGNAGPSWYSAPEALFSSRPHLCLVENFWDGEARVSTQRYLIVDAATAEVTRYAVSNEAYSDEEYESLVSAAGFEDVRLLPSLIGVEDESQSVNLAITARKPEA